MAPFYFNYHYQSIFFKEQVVEIKVPDEHLEISGNEVNFWGVTEGTKDPKTAVYGAFQQAEGLLAKHGYSLAHVTKVYTYHENESLRPDTAATNLQIHVVRNRLISACPDNQKEWQAYNLPEASNYGFVVKLVVPRG